MKRGADRKKQEAAPAADLLQVLMVHPFPAEAVCAALHERFAPRHLVITLGPEGMLLSEGGRPLERIPTFAREVFDVSGAGDTVIAALTLAIAAGFPLPDAARFANVAAGIVVGKLGTATASPEEIRRAWQQGLRDTAPLGQSPRHP